MPVRKAPPEGKRPVQMLMQDEAGKDISPSIKEIDDAADDYQRFKTKRIDGALKLKEAENDAYEDLDTVLTKHKDALGAAKQYTYTDAGGKRKTIKYGKPRITIKAAKAERGAKKSQRTGNEINPK